MQSNGRPACDESAEPSQTWDGIASRPYNCRGDWERLYHLLAQGEPCESWFFNPNQLASDPGLARSWEDREGNLLGVAVLWPLNDRDYDLYSCAHPKARAYLEPAMIAWAKSLARKLDPAFSTLLCWASVEDSLMIKLLEDHGFRRHGDDDLWFMECILGGTVPAPQMPPGYTVRPFHREDAAAWMALWRDVWEEKLTADKRLAWLAYPSYVPDLDLVVAAPDGTLAAFCVCNLFRDKKGEIEDDGAWLLWLGTAPAYRRRGLARALLRTALQELQAYGCRRALLVAEPENTSATRLYEGHGFRVLYRMLAYVTNGDRVG